jgi:pimeloyl-ACP methyl ester carboxylesterase
MHDMLSIRVGSARLAVHTCGAGPLTVLVHGYPLDHRMWIEVLRGPLADRRQLAAVDLRGHGRSPWSGDEVHAMELFADDLAAVIETLGGPADVVALSMGGYAALALSERHPRALRSLVLVDTRAGADTAEQRRARDAAIDGVLAGGRRWLAEQMLPKLVAPSASATVRARLQTMIEGTAVETILADLRGMRDRSDRLSLLPSIAVPTLVVVGEQDELTPPSEARRMADAIGGARLVVVPGAGHMVPMEAPAPFAEVLAGFLD